MTTDSELEAIERRYARRRCERMAGRYDPLDPANLLLAQERERCLVTWLRNCGLGRSADIRLLEIGCGNGANLLQFLRLGFSPENLVGNELLAERVAEARRRLPASIAVLQGNAAELEFPTGAFDVVLQSTVFTSILDENLQAELARRMWNLVRAGGGVLWYDFIYDNPRNRDVRGVPVARIRELFPGSDLNVSRLTLAPPIARRVTRLNPGLYTLFNCLPWLRTHVLCWIRKPAGSGLIEPRNLRTKD